MGRRLAAIMAGDVAGYTRLMAEDQEGTYDSLRAAMDEVVRPAVVGQGGHVFKTTGDGFLAAFGSAAEAIDAAVAIQEGFASRPLQLRIGLNLGDVIEEENDVFGDGVNVAARLEAMAEPGGICVSAAVVRSAGRRPRVRFERLGMRRGKNMAEAVEVFAARPRAGSPRRRLPGRRLLAAVGTAALALLAGLAVHDGRLLELVRAGPGRGEAAADLAARPAVAVLPFDNLSGDPAQDYFSAGLTEDIITDLARNRELLVIARNSTFAFKDRATDVRAIGAQLGAGYVVEGSARRAGDQLRVVAQLIDATTGTHLWSKSYDRRIEDVFEVQDDLTSEIVASLVSYVRETESAALAMRGPETLRAYDLVLQARERFQHGSADPKALLEARALLERAVELDPGYAVARAQLGLTYIVDRVARLTGTATERELEEGLRQVREAIRLEPELALAYQVLSYGLAGSDDHEGSMRAARRAVELSPSDPESLMSLAKAQVRFGGYAEAVASAERARRLHPLAPQYYPYIHGQALYAAGRLEEADQVLADCLLRVPAERNCLRIRVATLVRLERVAEARTEVARLIAVDPAFSIASEQASKRFGDFPLMRRYLDDLRLAGAPEVAGQA
jgi:adenylate cyclase